MSRRVTAHPTPMSSGQLPQVSRHPDLESVVPERTSGRTRQGAHPIIHHVAEPRFEHPDKAGRPRVNLAFTPPQQEETPLN
jgi:hypothetical protein